MGRVITFIILALILTGCDEYPNDPDHTLRAVQNSGILRVGVIEYRPWAYRLNNQPQGIEVSLVSDFAQSLKVTPQWTFVAEPQAAEKLKNNEYDIVIGGLVQNNPRKQALGFTRPYLKTGEDKQEKHVFAVPQGENRFLVTLERFLKDHADQINALYDAGQTP